MQRVLNISLGNGGVVSMKVPALSGLPAAPLTLGSVSKGEYLQRISRAIAYDGMRPWPETLTEDDLQTWIVETSEGIICAWLQQAGDSIWVIGLLLEALPEYPLENPPRSLERIIVIEISDAGVDEREDIPREVADASLAALPYAGLPRWAWIAGGVGLVAMLGVVMTRRR